MTQLAIKWPFSFPPHPTSASALSGKNRTENKCALKSTKKTLYNFIFLDVWPPTANQLQGLTVVQQHIY